MNHLKLIHQYLGEKRSLDSIHETGYPFVTISREAGAGGHVLAYVLITDFLREENQDLFGGWHVFDRDLCEVVAQDPELKSSMDALIQERYESMTHEFLDSVLAGRADQYLVHKQTFHVVRMLSLLGKVIIVGRAGAMVTKNLPNGIHVRLVASEASRVRWMMKKLKIRKDEAEKLVSKQDRDRRRMARNFFNADIHDPLVYDAVFNSDRMELTEMSQIIIGMLKARHEKKKGPA